MDVRAEVWTNLHWEVGLELSFEEGREDEMSGMIRWGTCRAR